MVGKETLIAKIAAELQPEEPLKKPVTRYILWLAISVFSVISVMIFMQPFRSGFLSQLTSIQFLIECLLGFSSIFSLGYVLYYLSVPGLKVSKKLCILALLPFVGLLMLNLAGHFGFSSLPSTMSGKRNFCFYEVLVWSWGPILIMIHHFQKSFMRPTALRGFTIGLVGASFPMALMLIACMYDPHHIMTHHLLPLFYVATATAIIYPNIFKSNL